MRNRDRSKNELLITILLTLYLFGDTCREADPAMAGKSVFFPSFSFKSEHFNTKYGQDINAAEGRIVFVGSTPIVKLCCSETFPGETDLVLENY